MDNNVNPLQNVLNYYQNQYVNKLLQVVNNAIGIKINNASKNQ